MRRVIQQNEIATSNASRPPRNDESSSINNRPLVEIFNKVVGTSPFDCAQDDPFGAGVPTYNLLSTKTQTGPTEKV